MPRLSKERLAEIRRRTAPVLGPFSDVSLLLAHIDALEARERELENALADLIEAEPRLRPDLPDHVGDAFAARFAHARALLPVERNPKDATNA